jgi:polysaccharide export outer membrane protein
MALGVAWAMLSLLGAQLPLQAQLAPSAPPQLQQALQGQSGAALHLGASTAPGVAPEGLADLKLAPGSMVDIHVFEEPDLDGSYRLDDHGQISMPFAGTVRLESLTLPEAAAAVREKLETEEILRAPHVVVNINEYSAQNIVVMGEVAAPGRFPVLTARKLMDVLAMSGGQTPLAGNEIIIHRSNQPPQVTEVIHYGRDVNSQASLNVAINPGDSVLVKRAGIVYVLGAVNRPGGFPMQEDGDLNIAQALALAFGTAPQASIDGIRVIRKLSDGSVSEIPTRYNQFSKGKASPLALEAEDVVFVPASKLKSAFMETKAVLSSAASATIYTVR